MKDITVEETYQQWRSTLKRPDDSVFFYHPSLDRILLGLAIYVLSSRSLTNKLGKAKMFKILNLQVPDLLTAWIDEDEQSFETLFPMVMTVTDGLLLTAGTAEKQFPRCRKQILFLTRRHGMDFNPFLDPSLLSIKKKMYVRDFCVRALMAFPHF